MAPKNKKPQRSGKGNEVEAGKDTDDGDLVVKSESINFPPLQTIDIEYSLPKLHSVLNRAEVTLTMDDVDRVQLELEALLSVAARRRKLLCHQLDTVAGTQGPKRGRPPGGSPGSPGKVARANTDRTPKRFKSNQSRVQRDPVAAVAAVTAVAGTTAHELQCSPRTAPSSVRSTDSPSSAILENCDDPHSQVKSEHSAAAASAPSSPPPHSTASSSSPVVKNDIPDKFWATMEQYCGPITAKDVTMLERLRDDQELVDEFLAVPPLGRHYSLRWAEEDGLDDSGHESDELPKTQSADTLCSGRLGVLTERLISGLVGVEGATTATATALDCVSEESVKDTEVVPREVSTTSAAAADDTTSFSADASASAAAAAADADADTVSADADATSTISASQLERRLRRELTGQGVLTADEPAAAAAAADGQDQVMSELVRCQRQLRAVSALNMQQLERLLRLARHQQRRQLLQQQLDTADQQVQEAYRAVAAARQSKRAPTPAERQAAWRALQTRDDVIKSLDTQFPSADSQSSSFLLSDA